MATRLFANTGPRTWSMNRDEDGHREYKIKFLVQGGVTDGPYNAIRTDGLPRIGDTWLFGNDHDAWAFCKPNAIVTPLHDEKAPNKFFEIEFTFSTRPWKTCQSADIGNPLCYPAIVSGRFVKYMKEAIYNRFGIPITNSAFEQFRGQQVEFDANRPTVTIEQNVSSLDYELLCSMIDTVNDRELWGFDARCVKLSDVSWAKKYYGNISFPGLSTGTGTGTGDCPDYSGCHAYYNRVLEFDIAFDTFDRFLLDEGTKVLNGHWVGATGAWSQDNIAGQPPDYLNPQHFNRFKDRNGENTRVILNGRGLPAEVFTGSGTGTSGSTGAPGQIGVEYYPESNFLLLGIPTSF